MTKIYNIRSLNIDDFESSNKPDIFFATTNFEARSGHIPSLLHSNAIKKIALQEGDQDNGASNYGSKLFAGYGFKFIQVLSQESLDQIVETFLDEIAHEKNILTDVISVLIDVSSLSRRTIATLIGSIIRYSHKIEVELMLGYSLASYVDPTKSGIAPNKEVSPVHYEFSGWTVDPGKPVVAIVGLGYELDKAMGAVEYLQAAEWWLFEPNSEEKKYRKKVNEHNKNLISATPNERCIDYNVLNPVDTLMCLESLVAGLKREYKPVLLPFGPKLFFAMSLLVAAKHKESSVWYVSGEESEPKVDRKKSGYIAIISLKINSNCKSS